MQGRAYPGDCNPGIDEQRVNVSIDLAQHFGVESLEMLLPDGLYHARARLEEVKERMGAIPIRI